MGMNFLLNPENSILDVARRNSIDIPTLCHLKGATATGACRVCVVEVEGARSLVASCAAPAANDMVVRTESAKVIAARHMVIQLLLSSGNHNCAVSGSAGRNWTEFQIKAQQTENTAELCPVWGDCKLQELAFRYQVNGERFNPHRYALSDGDGQPVYCARFFAMYPVRPMRTGLQRSAGQSSHPLRLSRCGHQDHCRR